MKSTFIFFLLLLLLSLLSLPLFSQYTQTEIDAFLNAATGTNSVGTEILGNARYFYTNNYPNHDIGQKNANIEPVASASTWAMCAFPRLGGSITQLYSPNEVANVGCTGTYNFGVALNGIKFGPSSAAFFEDGNGDEVQEWHLEALYFETLDGDGNNDNIYGAHSTGTGLYHYHGDPVGYFAETIENGGLGIDGSTHSPIVGYAADGFPIYYKYVYANIDGTGGVEEFNSGYQLKTGSRGGDGTSAPDGNYDGEYVEDYEFTVSTKLDECNGRFGVTPDFPKGTYFYVITANWPVIPRCFAGAIIDNSFLIGTSACDSEDHDADSDCSPDVSSNAHTWTGETNTDWDTVTNWVDDSAPSTSGYASIPNVSSESGNFPTIGSNIEVVDVIIYPNAQLNVGSGKSLTLSSNLTNQGTLTINSDATSSGSLLISGESSGNITYNRYLASSATSDEGWHLIGSPVEGETENDIISNGNLLINGSSFYSMAPYDNNSSGNSVWAYLNASSSNTLTAGKGFSIKRNGSGTIPFTGTYRTTNLKDYEITQGTQNSWNLIANPFPSFMAANDDTPSSANFLSANSGELDPSFTAIYVWNSTGKTYDIINNALEAPKYIPPGQGFFVYAKSGGGQVDIRQTMLSYQSENLFLKSSANVTPTITISINNGDSRKSTQVKYIEGTSTGLDVGYDAGLFGAVSYDLDIYSHLIRNSEGVNFGLQCLPPNNYESMLVPIGITAPNESNLVFSAELLNLPEGIYVYLEDRKMNTFTELNDSTSYEVLLNNDENGIGRFYLHTTENTLSNLSSLQIGNVNIHVDDMNFLIIGGLNVPVANIKLYSIIGKELFTTSFNPQIENKIKLPKFAKGVYVVQINSKVSKFDKKIILK